MQRAQCYATRCTYKNRRMESFHQHLRPITNTVRATWKLISEVRHIVQDANWVLKQWFHSVANQTSQITEKNQTKQTNLTSHPDDQFIRKKPIQKQRKPVAPTKQSTSQPNCPNNQPIKLTERIKPIIPTELTKITKLTKQTLPIKTTKRKKSTEQRN